MLDEDEILTDSSEEEGWAKLVVWVIFLVLTLTAVLAS